jgi:hypothetical protein
VYRLGRAAFSSILEQNKESSDMKRSPILALGVLALFTVGLADLATAREPNCKGAWSCWSGKCQRPWNEPYYNPAWGMPVAVVVPPTAELQTHWGWGVGNTRVTPICPRFKRDYPGPLAYDRALFQPMPPWPSDTDQFGYYYVRGPW